MGLLAGKSVLITGASRGIGAAAAAAMAAEGAALLLLARTAERITALATRLRKSGVQVEAMTCDVAEYTQVACRGLARTRGLRPRRCACQQRRRHRADRPDRQRRARRPGRTRPTSTSRASSTACARSSPEMRARGTGVIVNLGSGAAHNPLEGWSHYCAAKAATAMLTRCAHLENRGRGIRVFSLSPGTVATDMQRKIRASGINPVSQMDFASHAPPEIRPGRWSGS